MLSDPDLNHVQEALRKLDFLVVQDIFLSETAQMADIVLPGACFAEKDGTFTNTERRVQRLHKAVDPPGTAEADWRIIVRLAERMGYKMHYTHPFQIMDEIASLTPIYGGMNYERLEEKGLQWPCPTNEHPGTKILHGEKFTRGLGRLTPVKYKPPAEVTDEEYPLVLSTGRSLFQFHTGTLSRRSRGLEEQRPIELAELNPEDARRIGIGDGQIVRIKSRRGELTTKVKVSEKVDKGVVFMTFHYREAPANILTNSARDPVARIPEFKVCAVRVEKA